MKESRIFHSKNIFQLVTKAFDYMYEITDHIKDEKGQIRNMARTSEQSKNFPMQNILEQFF